MEGRLEGKSVVITGAGAGIGRGISLRFAREGARIIVNDLNAEAAEKTAADVKAAGGEAIAVASDVATKEGATLPVTKCIEEWKKIDVLINNAWGGGMVSRLQHKTDEGLEHAFDVGPKAAYWAMLEAFPAMKEAGAGSIINFGSLNGVNAHKYTVEYNMAKESIRALTRTAAVEWGGYGIRANVICPAAATEAYEAFRSTNPEIAEEMNQQKPIPRMGDPTEDIGGVALFLATQDSGYVTGNTLFVDGGGHINGVAWDPQIPE